MKTSCEFLNNDEVEDWDDFVARSPQGSLFVSSPYLRALNKDFQLLAVRGQDGILAGIPLVRGSGGAHALPLFVKYAGILFAPLKGNRVTRATRQCELQDALVPELRRIQTFEYNFSPSYDNWLPLRWGGFAQTTLYTYRIGPARGRDWVGDSHSRVRRHIKTARRIGLRCGSSAEFEQGDYALLMAPYLARRVPPPLGESALRDFVEALVCGGSAALWRARDDGGRLQCAALVVEDRCWAYLLIHGCAAEAHGSANTALIAAIIDDVLSREKGFDFEGSVIRLIEKFYRGFGGELVPYSRIWRRGIPNELRRIGFAAAKRLLGYER